MLKNKFHILIFEKFLQIRPNIRNVDVISQPPYFNNEDTTGLWLMYALVVTLSGLVYAIIAILENPQLNWTV